MYSLCKYYRLYYGPLFNLWKYFLVPGFPERSMVLENFGIVFVLVGCFFRFCILWKIPAFITNTMSTKETWGKYCMKKYFYISIRNHKVLNLKDAVLTSLITEARKSKSVQHHLGLTCNWTFLSRIKLTAYNPKKISTVKQALHN